MNQSLTAELEELTPRDVCMTKSMEAGEGQTPEDAEKSIGEYLHTHSTQVSKNSHKPMVVWIASTRNTVLQTRIFHESYGFDRGFFILK